MASHYFWLRHLPWAVTGNSAIGTSGEALDMTSGSHV